MADPDGIAGAAVATGTMTTWADNVPPASSLTPNYYVSTSGNDASDGRSWSTAWQTLNHVLTAAPSGAIVEFGPGEFHNTRVTRTQPITLLAKYPAVDDN